MESRNGIRQPHSLNASRDIERCTEAEHRGDLNKTGVVATFVVRDVFRNVDGSPAVLTANGKPLQRANKNENHGRNPPTRFETWKKPNQGCCAAHNAERDEKSVLAANQIADPAKEQRPERPDHEADSERGKIRDVREGLIPGRIKFLGENGSKAAKDKKIIPLDHGAGGRSENHAPDAAFRELVGFDDS